MAWPPPYGVASGQRSTNRLERSLKSLVGGLEEVERCYRRHTLHTEWQGSVRIIRRRSVLRSGKTEAPAWVRPALRGEWRGRVSSRVGRPAGWVEQVEQCLGQLASGEDAKDAGGDMADRADVAEVGVLGRQVRQPRWRPGDRLLLSAISQTLPRSACGSLLPSPETLLRWHRELV